MEFQDLPLSRLRDLSELTATVAAAYDAGIFAALDRAPATPESLARDLELQERATGIILPVLEELGLAESSQGLYRLTARGRTTLGDPDSEEFVGGGLPLWLDTLRAFTRLPEVLAQGGPLERGSTEELEAAESQAGLARFMAAMAAAPPERVRRLVRTCLDRNPEAIRVLDLGGGPGHMARAFVREGREVTLFDRPETVEFVARKYGLSQVEGLSLVGGDFVTDPLPAGPFDIVLMSNIVHIYSSEENRRLLEKVAGSTRPGGTVAIADFFRGRSPRAAQFALVMLLKTDGGNTYSPRELEEWLGAAGFIDPVTTDLDDDRQLMTAVRGRRS